MSVDSLVEDVGGGHGTPATIAALIGGQDRKRETLLRVLHLQASRDHPEAVTASGFDEAMTYLRTLPPEERADVLRHPHAGPWLIRALRRGRRHDDDPLPYWVELGYLGWLAAAHRVAARQPGTVRVVVRDGLIMLPGLAGIRLTGMAIRDAGKRAADDGHGTAELVISADGGFSVDESEVWPLRTFASDDVTIVLDDLDPQRDLSDPYSMAQLGTAPPRLTEAQAETWLAHLAAAWQLLGDAFAGYASPMRAALTTIVPLTADPIATGASFTSFDALGCVNMSATAGPWQFALTLIHEFQHGKLAALTDLVALHEPDRARHLYAPWRDDPRPLAGLLQGIYAHIGVTAFWCHRRRSAGSLLADVEFARWRAQVTRALAEVRSSPLLTPAGHAFVAAMTTSTLAFKDEAVPERAERIAAESSLAHRVAWCVRNREVDATELVRRWREGLPPGPLPPPRLRPQPGIPADFRAGVMPGFLQVEPVALSAPEIAYAERRFADAAASYRAQLIERPAHPGPWAGLALALSHLVPDTAVELLAARAEVLCALAGALTDVDPRELLVWLATGG